MSLPERMAMNLLDALKKIIIALNEHRIEYALCGGLAMAVYALPRATLDIDIMSRLIPLTGPGRYSVSQEHNG